MGKERKNPPGIEILLDEYKKKKHRSVFDSDAEITGWEQKYEELFRRYWNDLAAAGKMKSKAAIRALDTIDARFLIADHMNGTMEADMDREAMLFAKGSIYNTVPPFEKGVIRLESQRYIQFRVEKANEDGINAVSICDFFSYLGTWCMDGFCVAVSRIGNNGNLEVSQKKGITMTDVFDTTPPPESWPYNDRLFWQTIVLPAFKSQRGREADYLEGLVRTFFSTTAYVNYVLSTHKALPDRKGRKKAIIPAGMAAEDISVPKRVVRTAGPVKFRSVMAPRLASEETIRTWHTGAWSRRGHTRTYKSGKQVYIRPTTCHRKGFDEAQAGQTVIRVKGKVEK